MFFREKAALLPDIGSLMVLYMVLFKTSRKQTCPITKTKYPDIDEFDIYPILIYIDLSGI